MKAPNGYVSWHETHFEIVMMMSDQLDLEDTSIYQHYENYGRGGLYELAAEWTDEFEELNKYREWDGEFFDEIDSFFELKCTDL